VTLLDKSAVLAGLFASWDSILALLRALSDEQWQLATCLPGWRVQDVVSHMIGTESMLAGIATPEADCDVAELDHVRNPIGAMNECWVRSLREETPAAMIDRFDAVTQTRRRQLGDMSDDQWNEVTATPAGPDTYGRFMRIRTFDCWMHEHDIRETVGLAATQLASVDAREAFDEMTGSMGFVVGKRGKAPENSRIEFDLTGPLGRTVRVQMNGRGSVVERFDGGDATSTIRLDGLLFSRLAGGRTQASQHRAEIALAGDVAVGQVIVDNLAYVI
jgi:uncharacterized protein (TIGR03083 family)